MKLIKVGIANVPVLHEVAKTAYAGNFHTHWEAGGLEWYLDREFGIARLTADLEKPDIVWWLIYVEEAPVGFVKLNTRSGLDDLPAEACCELEKIYVLPDLKGGGIGKKVLAELIDRVGETAGKRILHLCVLDTNLPSIGFYKKAGFTFHSKCRLELPYFKDAFRGMDRMVLDLDKAKIDRLTARFFDIFTNADGRRPDWDAVYSTCIPEALIIKKSGLDQEVYNLDSFIAPRRKLLSGGALTGFSEWEESEETRISGHIAQRFSQYRKKGVMDGRPFEQSGRKLFQFIKTGTGWQITAVVWEDY
ncbi:MAG: GNAT family N-acetyltransferase [Lewinellaceae bacterium]|nr:GNAT family N-acetyltransferase [Lewinellaceae bacterium]